MKKKTTYLVVKCGNANEYHAAHEVDKIIEKNGYCWFAKYGNKIQYDRAELSNPNSEDKEVVLCLILFIGQGYKIFSYKIEAFSRNIKQLQRTYPSYYNQSLHLISTWIKVTKLSREQPKLDDLYVKSSYQPLYMTLKNSTAGHFLCIGKTVYPTFFNTNSYDDDFE